MIIGTVEKFTMAMRGNQTAPFTWAWSFLSAVVVGFVLVLWSASAFAAPSENRITSYAWLDDPTGSLTLADVRKREFTPYDEFLSRGFGDSATWVRLRVDPVGKSDPQDINTQFLVLRIRPLYLDEIELFDPLDKSGSRRLTGDRYPQVSDDYQSLNFNFTIPMGDAPRDIYLRMKSTSSRLLQVEAYTLNDLQRADRLQQLFYGIYLSLVGLFLVWAAISWLTYRDPVISSFLVLQCFAFILGAAIFGYVRDFFGDLLAPAIIDQVTSYASVLIVTNASLFYALFWKEYKPPKIFISALWMATAIGGFNLVLLTMSQVRLALAINMSLIFLMPILTFVMVFVAKGWASERKEDRPLVPKWLIFSYFSANLAILLAGALPGLGLAKGGAYSIYVGLMHGIFNGAFAVGILQYRSYLLGVKRANLALDLAIAQQEVLQERSYKEERERLLAMLAHELRTPLATVRMLLGKSNPDDNTLGFIKRSVNEMNAVIERSAQVNQLEDAKVITDASPIDVVAEINDLLNNTPVSRSDVSITSPSSVVIQSDKQLVRMVLSNLLDNAIKYREQGSGVRIEITPASDGKTVDLVFENTPGAAGFPDAAKLFTKYYRSPMAHRQTGSGLGMYLVKGLLKALQGNIEYQPTQHKVRFHVCLPVSLS